MLHHPCRRRSELHTRGIDRFGDFLRLLEVAGECGSKGPVSPQFFYASAGFPTGDPLPRSLSYRAPPRAPPKIAQGMGFAGLRALERPEHADSCVLATQKAPPYIDSPALRLLHRAAQSRQGRIGVPPPRKASALDSSATKSSVGTDGSLPLGPTKPRSPRDVVADHLPTLPPEGSATASSPGSMGNGSSLAVLPHCPRTQMHPCLHG